MGDIAVGSPIKALATCRTDTQFQKALPFSMQIYDVSEFSNRP